MLTEWFTANKSSLNKKKDYIVIILSYFNELNLKLDIPILRFIY